MRSWPSDWLGFVPGITARVGDLAFADRQAGAVLFGIFSVSVLINLVHVTFALVGLRLARTTEGAQAYLIGGGVGYLALIALGVVLGLDGPVTLAEVSTADTGIHMIIGVTMIALGSVLSRPHDGARRAPRRRSIHD